MKDFSKLPYVSRLSQLEGAISCLEGWTFGSALEFADLGDGLNIYCSGWVKTGIGGSLPPLPGLRQFADDLNKATAPVIEAYRKKLRQELANECVIVAAKALKDAA